MPCPTPPKSAPQKALGVRKAEPERGPAAMHGKCLSGDSHKGAAAAPALGTSAGSAQPADGGGGEVMPPPA